MAQRVNHTVITVTKRILAAMARLFRRPGRKPPLPEESPPKPVESGNGPFPASWPENWVERIRRAKTPVWFRYNVREGMTFRQFPLRTAPAPPVQTAVQTETDSGSPRQAPADPSPRSATGDTGNAGDIHPAREPVRRRFDPSTRQWTSPERETLRGALTPVPLVHPVTERPTPIPGSALGKNRIPGTGEEVNMTSPPPVAPERLGDMAPPGHREDTEPDATIGPFPEKRERYGNPPPTGTVPERPMTVPFPAAAAERMQWPDLSPPHSPGDRIAPGPVEIPVEPFPSPSVREPMPANPIRPLKFQGFPEPIEPVPRGSHETVRTVGTDEPERPWPDLEDFEPQTGKSHYGYGLESRDRLERLKREQKGDLWSVSRF